MNISFQNRAPRSLCAVFLAAAIIFLSFPFCLYADETTEDPEDNDKPYVYAVEIEFGSFGFYYDWGTWNVGTFSYETDPASTSPAADTVSGKPGWYGFDGITNQIKVTNLTSSSAAQRIRILIEYSGVSDEYSAFPLLSGSVRMYCYDSPSFDTCLYVFDRTEFRPDICEFYVGNGGESREVYLSFSGEPKTVDGEPFMSVTAQKIGYITLGVALADK